ncbi:DNA-binding protein, partial [bacterium]|nr:DNA-binding protein [bacterium]
MMTILIAGTEKGRASPLVFVERLLDEAHEIAGVGTIFPDEEGNPITHVHMACGRKDSVVVGCVRAGVKVWHVMEIIEL